MRRKLHTIFTCLFLAALITPPVVAQTPQPTVPLPFSPQVTSATSSPLDPLLVILITFAGVVLTALGTNIAATFKRRSDAEALKALVKAQAEETKALIEKKTEENKAEFDKQAQTLKDDIDRQNAADRRKLGEMFVEQVDGLKRQLEGLRESTTREIAGLREEVRQAKQEASEARTEASEARTETKTQTEITTKLQEENTKLRHDVDHMPEEIIRLQGLLQKKGNGDGQGDSETVLSEASKELVEKAKDDPPPPTS